ncbi:MAG: HpaII family restriction endonuclease [Treponema sp.]|nr:HpaII family restriction endonuclease [Treponema sp.]MBR5646805.1 HpaII family restriction endonuclease [Treponema sp.]
MELKGNKGEWSEIYIFFKLLSDGKVYAADKNMEKIRDKFLSIVRIIREEIKGKEYSYFTGETVIIKLNENEVATIDCSKIKSYKSKIWDMITSATETTFTNKDITDFLESIKIQKLKSPAEKSNRFFGGTQDIVLETLDYRSGINQIMGFSCKSDIDAGSTLFNASGDNTNFEYKIIGKIDDKIMQDFNILVDNQGHTSVGKRMKFLHDKNLDLEFINPVGNIARENLITCCGTEMPLIVGGMLKYYFYERNGEKTCLKECLDYLARKDFAKYGFKNNYDAYRLRIENLLYSMFTGLRLGKRWDGKSEVNGGYIVVKKDGDVVAYHSCIADEFKNFLMEKLRFETPSCSRHKCMGIYKKGNEYFIKFPLQLRFSLKQNISYSINDNNYLCVAEPETEYK